jgi:N-acyl homoserine lactone hydrolase
LFPNSAILMQRAEYSWIHSPNGLNDNINQLMALARELLGAPKNLQLIDGDTDVFGDGSVTLVSSPGHTPGHQSLLVHLKNSGFIILSGDVVHFEESFDKNIIPSLNNNTQASVASMAKIRRMVAMYKATLFINHDKKQEDKLRVAPCILRLRFADWSSYPGKIEHTWSRTMTTDVQGFAPLPVDEATEYHLNG